MNTVHHDERDTSRPDPGHPREQRGRFASAAMVFLGVTDLTAGAVVHTAGRIMALPADLSERIAAAQVRGQLADVRARGRAGYRELAMIGEQTLREAGDTVRCARPVNRMRYTLHSLDRQFLYGVDELHDTSEEILGRASSYRRHIGRMSRRWVRAAIGIDLGRAVLSSVNLQFTDDGRTMADQPSSWSRGG